MSKLGHTWGKGEVPPLMYQHRQERIKHNISMEDIAAYTGYNYKTIQAWEKGRTMPTAFKLQCYTDAIKQILDDKRGYGQ